MKKKTLPSKLTDKDIENMVRYYKDDKIRKSMRAFLKRYRKELNKE